MHNNQMWETFWSGESGLDYWKKPSQSVLALLKAYPSLHFPRALDLGCGIGRHAAALAQAGYSVTALDASYNALEHLKRLIDQKKLAMHALVGDVQTCIFKPSSFDLVISYNVIYHGRRMDMLKAIHNVRMLLRPGGIFFFTCPTRQDGKYGEGEQVADHTFLSPNSVTAGDMHYFCDKDDVESLLGSFDIHTVGCDEHWWELHGTSRFHSYWQVTARKAETMKN